MKKLFLSVIVLATLIGYAEAAPFQTLGMLRTPDAYVLPHKAAELVLAGYYRDVAKPDYGTDEYNGLIPYGMLGVGILDRVELGFFGGDDVYFLNAKFKILQETTNLPQIAIGMDNIFSPVNERRSQDVDPGPGAPDWADHPDKTDYEYFSPYFVMSKQAVLGGLAWMFNLGIGTNRYTGQVPRSRWFSGTFASIEISPFDNFAFQAEYDGKDFNAGVKYSIKNFALRVGAEAVEDWAKESEGNGYEDNMRVAFAVSYLFDQFAEAQRRRPDIRPIVKIDNNNPNPIVTTGEIPVGTEKPGTDVAVVSPGTKIPNPNITETSAYKELSPEAKELLAELRNLREERQKAQKALEDLRTWLQELKEQNR